MQLLGEEINTQVSVLASGSGGGDSDDLAGTALKDQEIAEADVVAWDGDGVGSIGRLGGGGRGTRTFGATWASIFIVVTHLGLGGKGTGRIYGLLRDADFFTDRLAWVTSSFDGLFSEANLFSYWLTEGRWINGLACDTNFFVIGGLGTRGVDGMAGYTDFLTEG